MRYAIEPLRKEGIRIIYYLDDICILSKTKQDMNHLTTKVRHHLEKLGFIINYKKSILLPSKTQEFLGFTFNSKTMIVSVPALKITSLMKRIRQVTISPRKSCRWIAGLLGKMTAMIPAVGEALLHIRYLQRDLSRTLHLTHQNWETTCNLSNTSLQELRWWEIFITQKNGLPIQRIQAVLPSIKIRDKKLKRQ
jgi:hypothetical protein